MDQNVIQFVKSHYKRSLLCSVISQYLTRINLEDVVFNLAHAWQNVPPETIICFWKKLWPSYPLSSGSSELTGPEESENDGTVLTSDRQEAIAEKGSSGSTIGDISNWLAGGDQDNLQIMTHEGIIFFLIYIVGGSPSWVPSTRRPLNGLLYMPRVIMMMEKLVE
jgi:hypothetical protein